MDARRLAESYFSKRANLWGDVAAGASDMFDNARVGASDLWDDVQAWRGWNQMKDSVGDLWGDVQPTISHWGGQALDFARNNPELAGAVLGGLGGGIGLTGLGSMSSAITGVPQRTPFSQRFLTNAALGALTGAGAGMAYRSFGQPGPSDLLG